MFLNNIINSLHKINEDSLTLASENRDLRHLNYDLQNKLIQKQKRINDLENIIKQLLIENNKNN